VMYITHAGDSGCIDFGTSKRVVGVMAVAKDGRTRETTYCVIRDTAYSAVHAQQVESVAIAHSSVPCHEDCREAADVEAADAEASVADRARAPRGEKQEKLEISYCSHQYCA
jgi:hypothetical protein